MLLTSNKAKDFDLKCRVCNRKMWDYHINLITKRTKQLYLCIKILDNNI